MLKPSSEDYGLVPSFSKDLSQNELSLIYSIGRIQKINIGEAAFKANGHCDEIFHVLKGALMIIGKCDHKPQEMAVLKEGDWLSEIDIEGAQKLNAVAMEPCTALVLPRDALLSLDEGLQIKILKSLNILYIQLIHALAGIQAEMALTHQFLRSCIRKNILPQSEEYERSEVILNLLKSIPRLPMYAHKVAQLLQEGSTSAREVSKLAGQDPSLVSEVLKTVNSSYYGLQKSISNFHHAVVYLGFNQVRQLIVSNGLLRTMPDTPEFRDLHEHSMVISHLAYELGRLRDVQKASLISTIALLHDIGKSLTLLLKRQNPKWSFLIDSLDSSKLGAMLLKEWNIPEVIYRVIQYQRFPELLPPEEMETENKEEIALLYLAHLCAERVAGRLDEDGRHPFAQDYLKLLRLPNKSIEEITLKYLVPSLTKKGNTIPEIVRNFLKSASATRL